MKNIELDAKIKKTLSAMEEEGKNGKNGLCLVWMSARNGSAGKGRRQRSRQYCH